jgi:hypothetical protein
MSAFVRAGTRAGEYFGDSILRGENYTADSNPGSVLNSTEILPMNGSTSYAPVKASPLSNFGILLLFCCIHVSGTK